MRILFAYYTHKPGGFCVRLYRLMAALADREHEVLYACLDEPPAHVDRRVHWERIPFPSKRRSGLLFWGLFTVWLPLWLIFRCGRSRPERFVAFGAYYAAMAAPACALFRIRLLLFLRSLTFEIDRITGKPSWLRRITGVVERFGILAADKVVCMTESMRTAIEEFVGRPLDRCEVLPNDLPVPATETIEGRHLHEYVPLPAGEIALFTAGVLDARKNVSVLLEALAELSSVGPSPFRLSIAGTGMREEALRDLSTRLGLSNVTFLGWCGDLAPLMREATVLVHPALHEGVANTVLESLAIGVPVLVSDIPEHRELFPNPINRIPPRDVRAWAAALENLTRPEFLAELRAASAEAAGRLRFDWDECASKIVV